MVDHLEDRTGDRLGSEGKRTEDDEPEVGHRGIGDESLEILLHRRRNCAVDDADHRKGQPERTTPHRSLGEQVEAEAEEPVRTELQHDAGEDDRTSGGRLRMGVGEPGVQREDRHLDSKRDGKGEEQPTPSVGREVCALGDLDEVEGEPAQVLAGEHRGGDEPDEHERRTKHCVEEELRRGVDTVLVAPTADEEVHRHEHDLEEDEEQEEIK